MLFVEFALVALNLYCIYFQTCKSSLLPAWIMSVQCQQRSFLLYAGILCCLLLIRILVRKKHSLNICCTFFLFRYFSFETRSPRSFCANCFTSCRCDCVQSFHHTQIRIVSNVPNATWWFYLCRRRSRNSIHFVCKCSSRGDEEVDLFCGATASATGTDARMLFFIAAVEFASAFLRVCVCNTNE